VKLAVVSTTIHGEKGYLAFDRLAQKSPFSRVCFVISGDRNSKPFDSSQFKCEVEYLDVEVQGKYHCSEPMGWQKIMRRNTALLRAIELKPDYILIIDDDNVPDNDYFDVWHRTITTPVGKIAVPTDSQGPHWHNYLKTSDADIEIYPRGYPVPYRWKDNTQIENAKTPISNSKIGVYQGISLGDPDIDVITRIIYPKPISSIGQKDYCLRNVWSPYNTQNTMFSKWLFPLAFVWPHCGRYDDIYSSFAWQKLLFNNDMYAFVGEAVNNQNRGQRNILKDMQNEVEGYVNSHLIWEAINQIDAKDPVDFIRALMNCKQEIIARHSDFMSAYLRDLEQVL